MGKMKKVVEQVAEKYIALLDRSNLGEVDTLIDAGEWSSAIRARQLEKAEKTLFEQEAAKHNVEVETLKEAVCNFVYGRTEIEE